MEERRQERRQGSTPKQPETTISSGYDMSMTPSPELSSTVPTTNVDDQPEEYVVKEVSGGSISTMSDPSFSHPNAEPSLGPTSGQTSGSTSGPGLVDISTSDSDEELDDSKQVVELKNSDRVLQGTDLSRLVDLSKVQSLDIPLLKRHSYENGSFKSLQGDCTGSHIDSIMKSLGDDEESFCLTRSPVSSVESPKVSFVTHSHGPSCLNNALLSKSPSVENCDGSSSVTSNAKVMLSSPITSHASTIPDSSVKSCSPKLTNSVSETSTDPTKSMGSSAGSMQSAPLSSVSGISTEKSVSNDLSDSSPPEESSMQVVATPESSPASKLFGESCMLQHSLERSPDTPSAAGEHRRKNELAQLEQIYATGGSNSTKVIPDCKNLVDTKQGRDNDDDDEYAMQDYIRHVYFVPAVPNSTYVSLGISLEDASPTTIYPAIKAICNESPLLDRIFVGDKIMAVNNVETLGFSSTGVTKLLLCQDNRNTTDSIDSNDEESEDTFSTPIVQQPTINNVIKLTIMSSQSDGSESDSDCSKESSSDPSQPNSEV
jgi:hypothetical protein